MNEKSWSVWLPTRVEDVGSFTSTVGVEKADRYKWSDMGVS